MFKKDIGIDLGTSNVTIYMKGKGVILEEPTVVAVRAKTKHIVAVGRDAQKMIGRTNHSIEIVHPVKAGIITDLDLTEKMLKQFLTKAHVKTGFSTIRLLICCAVNATNIEQKTLRDIAEKVASREVYLEMEPKIAAIGSGMDIFRPSGNMIIHFGGGKTDIAVLSLGDIVTSDSVKIGGNRFDEDIVTYIKKKHNLLIGELTAENIKQTIGTVFIGSKNDKMNVRGRDLLTGLPRMVEIVSDDVVRAVRDSVDVIIQATKNVLEKTEPELSADIIEKGIILTGGGALFDGFQKLLTEELLVPIYVAEFPRECIVSGIAMMLNQLDKVSKK